MCGQGYMLGPGLGEFLSRVAIGAVLEEDSLILDTFSPYRAFTGQEKLK